MIWDVFNRRSPIVKLYGDDGNVSDQRLKRQLCKVCVLLVHMKIERNLISPQTLKPTRYLQKIT